MEEIRIEWPATRNKHVDYAEAILQGVPTKIIEEVYGLRPYSYGYRIYTDYGYVELQASEIAEQWHLICQDAITAKQAVDVVLDTIWEAV